MSVKQRARVDSLRAIFSCPLLALVSNFEGEGTPVYSHPKKTQRHTSQVRISLIHDIMQTGLNIKYAASKFTGSCRI